jgi:hypothetical protein
MTYRRGSREAFVEQEKAGELLSCTALYRPITKEEYDRYWDSVEDLYRAKMSEKYMVNLIYADNTFREEARANNLSYDALGYYTQFNWPKDFALAFGDFAMSDSCFPAAFGIYVEPRQLFVQFAVIEAQARNLDIRGFTFESDNREFLREDMKTEAETKFPIGQVSLRRGESLIIPLRIELRYSPSERPISMLSSGRAAEGIYQTIKKFREDPLKLLDRKEDGKWEAVTSKAKSSFRAPEKLVVTQRYLFGKAIQLKRIWIDDKEHGARPAPPFALVSFPGGGEGSCPHLYFRSGDGDLLYNGRILVAASGPSKRQETLITIPDNTVGFAIREQEPEIALLKNVRLRNRSTGETTTIARDIVLPPRRGVELNIPLEFQKNSDLIIDGWYESLLAPVATAQ